VLRAANAPPDHDPEREDSASTQHAARSTQHFPVRAFERREVGEALAWARAGGIALHFFRWSHPRYGTGEYCHVLCADRERLIAFGAGFGWVPAVLQPPRRERGVWHYDAYGWRTLALRRLVAALNVP